jgi:arsenate reductase-like glutaredoxin family protein
VKSKIGILLFMMAMCSCVRNNEDPAPDDEALRFVKEAQNKCLKPFPSGINIAGIPWCPDAQETKTYQSNSYIQTSFYYFQIMPLTSATLRLYLSSTGKQDVALLSAKYKPYYFEENESRDDTTAYFVAKSGYIDITEKGWDNVKGSFDLVMKNAQGKEVSFDGKFDVKYYSYDNGWYYYRR